ncbi:serpin B3 [Trichonephila inaurata madagascariensis]|uniref:Serpin B3 n=1 Tax=Trichonephila inaurata madagascariensis TaxID=2747483 RepID=A0A8X6XAY6_9ARAC|nr:serpin B3 [Trichonephila inaurata madagascariensis]
MGDRFRFAHFADFKAVELPYKGENISMLILLPNQRDGLRDLEESLTPEELSEIQLQMYETNVMISLPKFKIRFEKELSPAIQALGANFIFRADTANFSGISPSKGVFVNQVLHKAVVKVNEMGSVASAMAVTPLRYSSLFSPPEFDASHPFLFAIIEKGSKSNMILFLGHVVKIK